MWSMRGHLWMDDGLPLACWCVGYLLCRRLGWRRMEDGGVVKLYYLDYVVDGGSGNNSNVTVMSPISHQTTKSVFH